MIHDVEGSFSNLSLSGSVSPALEFDADWAVSFVVQSLFTNEYLETNETSVRLRHGWESWVLQQFFLESSSSSQGLKEASSDDGPSLDENGIKSSDSNSPFRQKSGITMALESASSSKQQNQTENEQANVIKLETKLQNEEKMSPLAMSNKIQAPVLVGPVAGLEKSLGSNTTIKNVNDVDGDELFQFDEEENWTASQQQIRESVEIPSLQVPGEMISSSLGLESEFEDYEMESILIVAQRNTFSNSQQQSHPHGLPPRSSNNQIKPSQKTFSSFNQSQPEVLSDMINEGLFLYEKGAFKSSKISSRSLLTEAKEQQDRQKENSSSLVRPQPPILEKRSDPVNVAKRSRRFINGGLTAKSPPVGWMVHPHSQNHHRSDRPVGRMVLEVHLHLEADQPEVILLKSLLPFNIHPMSF